MRVLIQAGHNYPEGTSSGAPGERDWTMSLARLIVPHLEARGVEAVLVGGFYNLKPPPQVGEDYDLFVSLHYDAAGIYPVNSGCFAARADRDPCAVQSERFIAIWENIYPVLTGISLHNERRNGNTRQYYAFVYTSDVTPGVLLEHGVGMGDDHDILFNHADLIAEVDARAICSYLNVEWVPQTPEPEPGPAPEDPQVVVLEALRLANLQKREFETYIRDATHRQSVDAAAAEEGNNPADLMLRWAQDHFNAGEQP